MPASVGGRRKGQESSVRQKERGRRIIGKKSVIFKLLASILRAMGTHEVSISCRKNNGRRGLAPVAAEMKSAKIKDSKRGAKAVGTTQ